jgi:hypothetical protein
MIFRTEPFFLTEIHYGRNCVQWFIEQSNLILSFMRKPAESHNGPDHTGPSPVPPSALTPATDAQATASLVGRQGSSV